jgi:hypothetical protein
LKDALYFGRPWKNQRRGLGFYALLQLEKLRSHSFFVEKFTPSIRPEAAPALGLRLVSHEPMLSNEKSSQRA